MWTKVLLALHEHSRARTALNQPNKETGSGKDRSNSSQSTEQRSLEQLSINEDELCAAIRQNDHANVLSTVSCSSLDLDTCRPSIVVELIRSRSRPPTSMQTTSPPTVVLVATRTPLTPRRARRRTAQVRPPDSTTILPTNHGSTSPRQYVPPSPRQPDMTTIRKNHLFITFFTTSTSLPYNKHDLHVLNKRPTRRQNQIPAADETYSMKSPPTPRPSADHTGWGSTTCPSSLKDEAPLI